MNTPRFFPTNPVKSNTIWKVIFVFLFWSTKKRAAQKYGNILNAKELIKRGQPACFSAKKYTSWTHPTISKYFPHLYALGYITSKKVTRPTKRKKHSLPVIIYRTDLEKIFLEYSKRKKVKFNNYELSLFKRIFNNEFSRKFIIECCIPDLNIKDTLDPSPKELLGSKNYGLYEKDLRKLKTEDKLAVINIFCEWVPEIFLDRCVEKILSLTLYSSKSLYLLLLSKLGADKNNDKLFEKLDKKIDSLLKKSNLAGVNKGKRIFLWCCALFNKNPKSLEKLYKLLGRNVWREKMFRLYQLGMIDELAFMSDVEYVKKMIAVHQQSENV